MPENSAYSLYGPPPDDSGTNPRVSPVAPATPLPMPEGQPAASPVGYDPTSRKMWVNGFEFDADDHRRALASREWLHTTPKPMPPSYTPLSPSQFSGYIKRIKYPSTGRLMSKNFGVGVDNLQLFGGAALQALGAEETGSKIVKQQAEDLAKNEPYQRLFTDIDSAGGAVDWFVANLAQQGPMFMEAALVAALGALTGGTAAGAALGAGAIGRTALTMTGKQAIEKSALAAARKHLAKEALTAEEYQLLRTLAAGAAKSSIDDAAQLALKRGVAQGRIGGGIAGGFANNYLMGVGDITNEQDDAGTRNRAAAFSLAVPYSLLETLPELVGLGFFAKGVKGSLLKRVGKGLTAGTLGEGGTEAGQELINLSQNPETSATSREGMLRVINAFAAGAGVGGALGGAGALRRARVPIDVNQENVDLTGGATEPLQLPAPPRQIEDRSSGPGITPTPEIGPTRPSLALPAPVTQVDSAGNVVAPGETSWATPIGGAEARAARGDLTQFESERSGAVSPPVDLLRPEAAQSVVETGAAEPSVEEVYTYLREQQQTANPALAEAMRVAQERRAQEQAAQEQAQQQTLSRAAQADLAAREEQFAAEQAGQLYPPAVGIQEDLDSLPQRPGGNFSRPLAGQRTTGEFARRPGEGNFTPEGEPTVLLPTRDARTGKATLTPVKVQDALAQSRRRIESLEALQACLAGI